MDSIKLLAKTGELDVQVDLRKLKVNYRFIHSSEYDDEDEIYITKKAIEIDLAHSLYDFLTLEIPYCPVHPEDENGVEITGNNQHGFKNGRGTSTLSLDLQSMIGRAMDKNEYALLSSLDLSAAFDLVDVKLLIKRLQIIGLTDDVINLIKEWLSNRSYYVDIDGDTSTIFGLLLGTVQGSILGPILYTICVSQLFDEFCMLAFADDTFIPSWNVSLPLLIDDMQKKIEGITKWLKKSGMVVNQSKTEL